MEYFLFWKRTDVNDIMAYVILALSVLHILVFQEYNTKEILTVLAFSAPIIAGTFISKNYVLLSAWLFILIAKYIDFDKTVELSYVILIITIAIVLYMFFSGQIDEVVMHRGGYLRHSWGFAHPNWLGVRAFELVVAYCYIRRSSLRLYDYLFVILGMWFTYKIPNCQTAYVSLGILLGFLVLYNISDYFVDGKDSFGRLVIYTAAISNVASIVLSMINVKKYPVLSTLDRMLSWRFSNCYRTMKRFGIHLFGANVNVYSQKMGVRYVKYYLDTAYTSILVRYGIIVYILFSVLYICAMVYWYKRKNYVLVIIFGVYAIYGIMENAMFSLTHNIFLLGLAYPLYDRTFTEKTVKKKHPRVKVSFRYGI